MTAAPHSSSPWILSPEQDLLLFVGTPVLCAVLILPLGQVWSSSDIFLVVMAFSSMGHHLPGFLRAYADRELFERFRWRFLLAPPLLFVVFLWFGRHGLHGMALLLMVWSIWHVLMQHFGFLRIYDAKVGSTRPTTARMDWWMSVLWFVSIVLWSPDYSHNLLANWYASGGGVIPLVALDVFRLVVWSLTAVLTALYARHTWRAWRQGEPISIIKLAVLVLTTSFLYLVWVGVGDLLLGLATWEIFHDVQYFAITWAYNRRLVEKGLGSHGLMAFLFRRRLPLVVLYVAAILLYGSINYIAVQQTQAALREILIAFVFTSTILHYYFDGFIWKVRHPRVREGLDLETDPTPTPLRPWHAPGFVRGLAHVLLFAIPIGSLAALEVWHTPADPVTAREAIRTATPGAVDAHLNLALAYSQTGRLEEALESYRQARMIRPDHPDALGGYAVTLLQRDGSASAEEAASLLQEAVAERPRYNLNLAILALGSGRPAEAVELYRRAQVADPTLPGDNIDALLLHGLNLLASSRFEEAVTSLQAVTKVRPNDLDALEALALAAPVAGRPKDAEAALRRLVELSPGRLELRARLVQSLLQQGREAEARTCAREALTHVTEATPGEVVEVLRGWAAQAPPGR